jgi:D-alanyl-D-alanine-carboxypeptidase/D-alanyl-D-alanine-endopeptidase
MTTRLLPRWLCWAPILVTLPLLPAAPLTPADILRDVQPLIDDRTLQAVSIGVIQPDGTRMVHAGTLSPERASPPDDRTLYEIGSISKVFTGLLLADAVVRGDVSLDQPLARLLPDAAKRTDGNDERITLRMLSTHTSGLPRIPPEIPPDNYTNPYANYGDADLWTTIGRVALDAEPGAKASYSNLAVGLLGTVLARKADMTFGDLLAARITRPLEMTDTVVDLDTARRGRLAPPFTSRGEPWTAWDFQALAGAGGIRSTLPDMMRFAAAMLRPADSPLAAAIELAWAKQTLTASVGPGGQGLGWMLAGDGRTRWHNGMTGGFHAALFVNRELGVAVVLLSNRSTLLGTQLAEALVRRAAGMPDRPMPNANRATVALTVPQVERCTGTFRLSPTMVLVCEQKDGALLVTPTGQATDRLFAASATTFFSRRVPAELVFELPDDGRPATALTLKQGGRELRAPRE